jgi:hypothetical protein
MDYAPPTRDCARDEALDPPAIGPVVARDNFLANDRWSPARRCRKKLWMTDRAIEVDQQSADGGGYKRCPESRGQRPRHHKRT